MLNVWAFCHMTDINMIIQFIPNAPEHVLVNTQQLSWCVALDRLHLQEVGEQKFRLSYIPTRKNYKALDPDFLVANVSSAMFWSVEHVWNELDYRTDTCHVTRSSYIEHL
jgi:hypothetical protein